MRGLDPRVTPVRADLAAKFLQGKVAAPRYVEGRAYEVIAPQAPLRHEPRPDAPLDTEALKGERITVYDENEEGWAWGQLATDNYVGWLPLGALAAPGPAPTHKVAALRTFAFPGPSIKLPPVEAFPLGAKLAIARIDDRMAVMESGFYVPVVHLQPLGDNEADFATVAERFLGAPYLWGGKTVLGLDCSGLVQIALAACGVFSPRDTDMQERELGTAVGGSICPEFKRGDLVFWKGHVGIMRDDANLLHANAFHMAVASEPVGEAVARIRATGSEVTSVRRIAR